MAISSSTRKAGPFLGNDATTVFPFAFKVFTSADLRVVRTNALGVESDLVLDTDYTVALNANQDNDPGGTVTRGTALPTGERLTITSDVEALQPLVLTNNGGFYPRVINDAFDKITIIAQQLIEQVGRSLKLPISSSASATLPDPVANRLIAWNSSANGFTNVNPASLATVAAYADANLELFTGNGTQTAFTLAQDPAVLANLDVSISGVTQVGGEDFTWVGTTLTFVVAPPTGTRIQVRYTRAIPPADLAGAVAAAEADRVATAADRVQTGLDRIATAADVVSAEADRVATAADAVATAADRVQTGLDRVQTGLDATAAAATLAGAALKANNLSDLASSSTARANIGTGKIVTIDQFAGATDAIKLQAAFDANPTQIVFDRDVSINAAVTSNGNVRLIGTGETLTFTSTGSLTVGTGVTRIADLSVNVALDATTLTFGTSHGLAVNDVVAVWNPTDYSFGPARDYYREGDMYQVAEVISSTQVRIYGQAQQAMTAASFEVYKLNGGSFEIDGLDIVPSAGTQTPLYLDGLIDVRLNNLKMAAGGGATGVEIFRCYDIGVEAPDVRTTAATDSYPITISNSQKVTITDVRKLHSKWHSIALGGRDGNGTVPTADVIIADSILENDASTGIPAADIHGGCKRITYDGGFICGASMNGRDVTIRNARVLMTAPSSNNGICVQGSEVVGGTYTLENCELISGAIGVSFASHINLGVSAITSDFRLIVRNCTLQHTGSSGTAAGASLIRLELGAGALTPDILVDIDGLTYIGEAAPLTLLSLTGAGSLSAGSVVRIANVTGIDRVVAATNAANYNVSFSGPGITKGVTYQGDAGVTLTRASTTTQDFNTTLTADRFCDLPFGAACAGDEFTITRSGGGDGFNVIVRSATSPRIVALGQGSWVRLQFKGAGAGGEWVVAARGQTGGLYGVRLFGDVSAFIELTRTSQFFGRRENIWNTPLTTNRSLAVDGGAREDDVLRIVRTAAATGAFGLDFLGLVTLKPGQYAEAIYKGGAWVLTDFGSLGPDTGWTAMTGSGSKGALAAAAAGTASALYVQAELQAALNRIAALEARLKSFDDVLFNNRILSA